MINLLKFMRNTICICFSLTFNKVGMFCINEAVEFIFIADYIFKAGE